MLVSVFITYSHGRAPLLYARPVSEQLRGISLVSRKPIAFPPRYLLSECTWTELLCPLTFFRPIYFLLHLPLRLRRSIGKKMFLGRLTGELVVVVVEAWRLELTRRSP